MKIKIPMLRDSLESIADIQKVYIDNIDEMEQSVYKELKTQNVDIATAEFVYAALGEAISVANSKDKFGDTLACVHIPDLSAYLYFSRN
tara:strand:+ start:5720 stop:5986 length:267 start_codon:yes stop_codon:yes gene_type:complete